MIVKLNGGYTGNLVDIDLTAREIQVKRVAPAWAEQWIGSRGWAARILWEHLLLTPTLDPLGPDNVITIASGPLTGLLLPSSGKTHIAAISPATGIYGDSNIGGKFGAELKFAGYDAIVLRGASDVPVYLWIDDDAIELRAAGEYWGRGSLQTEEDLRNDLGDEFQVLTIGPAGEKRVGMACITTGFGRNAGRAGLGAVLGSKRVKAIAVQGSQDIPVAHLDDLLTLSRDAWRWILDHPNRGIYHRQGTMMMVDIANTTGILPTRNFTDAHFESAREINGDLFEAKYRKISRSCSFCPMFCGQWSTIPEGPFKGCSIEGPEYETATMLGAVTGVHELDVVIYANYLCDELGVDTISAGNLTGLAMEMRRHNMLTPSDVDGVDLAFGSGDALIAFINMIGHRTGIGAIFADGVNAVLEKWPAARRFAMQTKGLEQSAYDTRASPDMALAYATCDIGAHHTRAWTIGKLAPDASDLERAQLVVYHQHIRPLFDSLGVCRFPWIELGFPEERYAQFYHAATGRTATLDDLLRKSEAIYNLTRAINVVRGVSRKDDYPPPRVYHDAVQSGPNEGATLTPTAYERLLDTYYRLRGWSVQTGIPERATLSALNMRDVAEALTAFV